MWGNFRTLFAKKFDRDNQTFLRGGSIIQFEIPTALHSADITLICLVYFLKDLVSTIASPSHTIAYCHLTIDTIELTFYAKFWSANVDQ